MANYYKNTRIVPLILLFLTIAIAVAALVSIARVIFFSGNTGTTTTQTNISKETLLSTNADRSVTMTVRGKLIADESYRSYQIRITPNERKLTTYKGYLDQPISNITLGNNLPSYEEFVYALYRNGLINGTEPKGDKNDTRGICASGFFYEFQVLKADKSVKSLWTSTCEGSPGSLTASYITLTNLFTVQIPNAQSLTGTLFTQSGK
jgi:hypothetical protein